MADYEKTNGFTLVELIVIVAILGVVAALATPSFSVFRSYRIGSSTSELSSDLQRMRVESLTSASGVDSRGFGIRFADSSSYTIFEFNDCNGNYQFDSNGCSGDTEALDEQQHEFPSDIYVTIKNSSMPAGEMLLYDKRGMARNSSWGFKQTTFVVRHRSDNSRPKCIAVDTVRIREGTWNGSECEDK